MISNPHRTNSNFQLKHFIAGSCHTADGAWLVLYSQKIDVMEKVAHAKAQELRRQAASLKAQRIIENSADDVEIMIAKAEQIELQASKQTWELNVQAANQELNAIVEMMQELEPQRKFSHLSILEASEASQREEWLGELLERCENFMIAGGIPADQLTAMRCHPDFDRVILPRLKEITIALTNCTSPVDTMKYITQSPNCLIKPD